MVEPTNFMPRFLRSFDIRSDRGEVVLTVYSSMMVSPICIAPDIRVERAVFRLDLFENNSICNACLYF